jgi:hypothetical protein
MIFDMKVHEILIIAAAAIMICSSTHCMKSLQQQQQTIMKLHEILFTINL